AGNDTENHRLREKIKALKDLEALGSQVLMLTADVQDPEQMQAVVTRVKDTFGHIDGVIHAAGAADGAMIQLRSPGDSRKVFATKIKGTLVLEQVLKDTPLDFLAYCSSIASILTQPGQVAYCAANCFLDAYANRNFFREKGTFTVAINWDRWQSVGIANIIEKKHRQLTGETLSGGITPTEGAETFNRILRRSLPQVIVATKNLDALIEDFKKYDLAKIMKGMAGPRRTDGQSLHKRPDIDSEYVAPGDDTQTAIAVVWQNFFGFEPIGIQD
ncbi:MAG: SDR family NAD(P)-dependent oxidoreductase, partial [bacterium]|nr:SDR family NAD(P)-dependent oxidoreductase [bacterium]